MRSNKLFTIVAICLLPTLFCNCKIFQSSSNICNKTCTELKITQTNLLSFQRFTYTIGANKLIIDSLYNFYSESKQIFSKTLSPDEFCTLMKYVPKIMKLNDSYKNSDIIDGTDEEVLILNDSTVVKKIRISNVKVVLLDSLYSEINNHITDGRKKIIKFY